MRVYETISGQEIRYPEPDAKLARFLKQAQALADDPVASDDDLVALIYGRQNPILDHSIFPERGAVTKEVLANPVYAVLTDLLARKTLERTKTSPEKVAARYTLTVADAAERKGVSEDALRKAIRERRLAAWRKDGVYFLEPKSLDAVSLGGRGPVRRGLEPLHVVTGYDAEADAFLRVKAPGVDPDAKDRQEGVVSRWSRVGVLTGGHGKLRFLELAPSSDEWAIDFHGFGTRGRFTIVMKINNPKKAREAWEAFEPA